MRIRMNNTGAVPGDQRIALRHFVQTDQECVMERDGNSRQATVPLPKDPVQQRSGYLAPVTGMCDSLSGTRREQHNPTQRHPDGF